MTHALENVAGDLQLLAERQQPRMDHAEELAVEELEGRTPPGAPWRRVRRRHQRRAHSPG